MSGTLIVNPRESKVVRTIFDEDIFEEDQRIRESRAGLSPGKRKQSKIYLGDEVCLDYKVFVGVI